MKLPKIPIDYAKAHSREVPFDGEWCLLHSESYDAVVGQFHWDEDCQYWIDIGGNKADEFVLSFFTHYTPMPEFEVKGDDLCVK